MNLIDLNGRVGLITGGASGMGFATARRFLESGASVEIWGRDESRLEAASRALAQYGRITPRQVDITDCDGVNAAAEQSRAAHGHVDILVNCAGATPGLGAVTSLTPAIWRENLAINLDSVFYCCSAFLPAMLDRGWGRIINISSMAGKEGNPFQAAYSAAKAGVLAFTKSLAKETATSGVTVNAVAPGLFATPMLDTAEAENPEAVRLALEKIPMKRVGQPEEAAALLTWIASDQCSFTTGFTFDLSGGRATY